MNKHIIDAIEAIEHYVAEKDTVGWQAVEQSCVVPEFPNERREQIIKALEAAELHYYGVNSYDGHLVFYEDNGTIYNFPDMYGAVEWLNEVVFDDPDQAEAVERILYPDRDKLRNNC